MIRILDEERSLAFDSALGFEDRGRKRVGNDTATIIFLGLPGDGDRLELTINDGRTEPYAQGEAYGHIALTLADMDEELAAWPSMASPPSGSPTPLTRGDAHLLHPRPGRLPHRAHRAPRRRHLTAVVTWRGRRRDRSRWSGAPAPG